MGEGGEIPNLETSPESDSDWVSKHCAFIRPIRDTEALRLKVDFSLIFYEIS